jgi:hypothetical protein
VDAVFGWGCCWGCYSGGRCRGGASGSDSRDAGISTEIIQSLEPEQAAVGGVERFGGVFPDVVLVEGEEGSAVAEARGGDGADFDLGGGGEAAQVEGFEGALGEVEAAI